VGPILALIAPSPLNKILIQIGAILNQNWSKFESKLEQNLIQNTECTYHCIIMHIFKKQKEKEKQSIIKLNKQSINLT
jgi:hypothetical protein